MSANAEHHLCTGVRWHDRRAALVTHSSEEQRTVLTLGEHIVLRTQSPRHCVGIFDNGQRTACTKGALLPASSMRSQCVNCVNADPTTPYVRGYAKDDGRCYQLYLAWFGPKVFKVGMTAAERQASRLCEQAAIAFTWLARGSLTVIRRAELAVAQSGLAVERVTTEQKCTQWWSLGSAEQRATELRRQRQRIINEVTLPSTLDLMTPHQVHDHTELFGLSTPLPDSPQRITELAPDAIISGRLRVLAGSWMILDSAEKTLVLDGRLLRGWSVLSTPGYSVPSSWLPSVPLHSPHITGVQAALF